MILHYPQLLILIVLRNVFDSKKFQEDFLEAIKNIEELKDIVVIYEDAPADKRIKIFKALEKNAKCQECDFLAPAVL